MVKSCWHLLQLLSQSDGPLARNSCHTCLFVGNLFEYALELFPPSGFSKIFCFLLGWVIIVYYYEQLVQPKKQISCIVSLNGEETRPGFDCWTKISTEM